MLEKGKLWPSRCPVNGMRNKLIQQDRHYRRQRGLKVRSSSSTGSSCLLEGSRGEACPVEREETGGLRLYSNPCSEHVKGLFTESVSRTNRAKTTSCIKSINTYCDTNLRQFPHISSKHSCTITGQDGGEEEGPLCYGTQVCQMFYCHLGLKCQYLIAAFMDFIKERWPAARRKQ